LKGEKSKIYILGYEGKNNAWILYDEMDTAMSHSFLKIDCMKQVICAGGFIVKKNKFLFGKRSKKKTWAAGMWDLVGGKALKNENPFYTLSREVYEETGIVVLDAKLMSTLHIFDESTHDFFIYHIYMITQWRDKARNCSKEHSKLRYFSREKLGKIELALPEYLPLIDKWINDIYLGIENEE
jgi:8-oxo-dGTP pyrophosphatase MutT (NUDIX family)